MEEKFIAAESEKLLINFKNYLIEEERSLATIEKYLRDVKFFLNSLDQDKIITRDSVLLFKQMLIKEYKVSSANSMLAALNQFLQFIGAHCFTVKRIKVQQTSFRAEDKELSENEYKRMVKLAYTNNKQRLGLILETICSTGIRISELQYFTVKTVKEGVVQINNKGKTRIILIPDLLKKKLLFYISMQKIKHGKIFITSGGKAVDRSNIWRDMKKLGLNAKVLLQKVFPHNLRHLFAKSYYHMFNDLIGLADILGHTNIETTRIYTIATGAEYKKRLQRLQLII